MPNPSLPSLPGGGKERGEQTTVYMTAEQTREFLVRQRQQTKKPWASLDCECGRVIPIRFMYRCLYCGIWLCQECAEVHFGQTREEYKREQEATGAGHRPPLIP